MKIFYTPGREVAIIIAVLVALVANYLFANSAVDFALIVLAAIGALPAITDFIDAVGRGKISLGTFNLFAVVVAFSTGELRSAAFIVLMLACASILEWHTAGRSRNAVEELLKLKPNKAVVEREGIQEEIKADSVAVGDIVLVKRGDRIPVDGVIMFGQTEVNEASVTGESRLVEKLVGDNVLSSTLNEGDVIKIRAVHVGDDSTVGRMAKLIEEASTHKSKPEKLADKFAAIFLPAVIVVAIAAYFVTKSLSAVAAIFLVACADDIAVAIPLAIMASIGRAAKRGVIIKGGQWLDVLSNVKIVVLDKTGTLTYGNFLLKNFVLEKETDEKIFWRYVAIAEKFSEHPIGRAVFKEAARRVENVPDPDKHEVVRGAGVSSVWNGHTISIGKEGEFAHNKTEDLLYKKWAKEYF
ncbi:MAG: HAD-IC family P-type ATPase, partial [Candidatus Paceibacterota bacterium]